MDIHTKSDKETVRDEVVRVNWIFTPSPTGNQSEMECDETACTAKIRRGDVEIYAYVGKARRVILGRSEVVVTSGG